MGARSTVSCLYDTLTPEELEQVWGDIYCAANYQAPSGSMFAGGVRGKGLALMAEHGIEEGIPVGIGWPLRQEGWGNGSRKSTGIPLLLKYGEALMPYLPEINVALDGWTGPPESKNRQPDAEAFRAKLSAALDQPGPKLTSIKHAIEQMNAEEFYTTERSPSR